MLTKQLSIFIQNQPGHLAEITEVLARNGIDIRAINVTEGHDFGILRIIPDDPYKAEHILEEEGYLVKMASVLAIEPDDRPGIMSEIFRALADAELDIKYIYSIIRPVHGKMPTIVLKTSDSAKAESVIRGLGIPVVSEDDIYQQVEG
ncbi:MAG: ACT domain-containing protein [Eubacteriaceae bacterium]|jgi:hypothetical protein